MEVTATEHSTLEIGPNAYCWIGFFGNSKCRSLAYSNG